MASLITGLVGGATNIAGGLTSSAATVGGCLFQGISLGFDAFLSIGSWFCSCFSLLFACCTGVGHKAFSEALRPADEWDESEAKRVGTCRCMLACALSCSCILLITAVTLFTMTYLWYL